MHTAIEGFILTKEIIREEALDIFISSFDAHIHADFFEFSEDYDGLTKEGIALFEPILIKKLKEKYASLLGGANIKPDYMQEIVPQILANLNQDTINKIKEKKEEISSQLVLEENNNLIGPAFKQNKQKMNSDLDDGKSPNAPPAQERAINGVKPKI